MTLKSGLLKKRIGGTVKAVRTASYAPAKVSLKELFSSIADEMVASFNTMTSVSHAPTRGGGHEIVWREWLCKYLPNRYKVDGGFIIDSAGNQSLQQDLIIFDRQYSPLLLNKDGILFVPAEAVYAVIEVKSKLGSSEIADALNKISSAKALLRTPSQAVNHAGGLFPPKERGPILGYVVANGSKWKSRAPAHIVSNVSKQKAGILDGGCLLEVGAFSIQHNDGKVGVRTVNGRASLFGFLTLIIEDLKPLGTVPPWDLCLYSDTAKQLRRAEEDQATPAGQSKGKLR